MICRKPYSGKGGSFGCGQCIPCRVNRRRLWTDRLLLEALVHEDTAFVTLTYRDEKIPDGGSLEPVHLQRFLKRLRKHVEPTRVRFFAVGEYGDLSARPHYHLVVYGVGHRSAVEADRLHSEHPQRFERRLTVFDECWDFEEFGNVDVRELSVQFCQYVCGYVVKKLTCKDDPYLGGRYPEFARMSLRPGIGALSVEQFSAALQCEDGRREIVHNGDVPQVYRRDGKRHLLGRYLRRKLRLACGLEEGESSYAAWKRSAKMLDVYAGYTDGKLSPITGLPDYAAGKVAKEVADKQRCLQIETKLRIKKEKKL